VGCVEYSQVSERQVSLATETWEEINIKVEKGENTSRDISVKFRRNTVWASLARWQCE